MTRGAQGLEIRLAPEQFIIASMRKNVVKLCGKLAELAVNMERIDTQRAFEKDGLTQASPLTAIEPAPLTGLAAPAG